jgi:hypothetical protein
MHTRTILTAILGAAISLAYFALFAAYLFA